MPPKKYARKYKKKTYRRKANTDYVNATLSADRELVWLDYSLPSGRAKFSSGVLDTFNHGEVQMNSIYRPLVGTAEPVIGFSNYMSRYEYYRVLGFYYDITFVNNTTYATNVVIIPQTSTTSLMTSWDAINKLICNPKAKYKMLSTYQGGAASVRFRGYVDQAKLHGDTSEYNSSVNYAGQVSSSPASVQSLFIGFCSSDGVSGGMELLCQMKLRYKVEFYKRKNFNI